jgi:RimJ/RimL family protein N-acetyltransferase
MIFSETASLRIRGYREFDLLHLVALFADPRVMRSYPGPVVPASEPAWTRTVAGFVEKALLWAILEAKTPANDGHDWVGFVALTAERAAKNREVEFGIALHAAHEGKGYGASRLC